MRWRSVVVGLPPLALAVVGFTHPMILSSATSEHWTLLHVALIPVFPLLGLCLWWLLRGVRGPVAATARIMAFFYACFYSALDTINGVAVGMIVWRTPVDESEAVIDSLRPVLNLGNSLAWIGSFAFLLSAILTGALLIAAHGRRVIPGAALTILAAVSFLNSHIYWPRGVLTMIVLAVGFVLLSASSRRAALVDA